MFNKEEKNGKDSETVIGVAVKVRGDFQGKGNVVVEGELDGSLTTDGSLYVGERASIKANVSAREAKILGKVTGNISLVGLLELGPQARIEGDLTIGALSVANGATINGQIIMNLNKPQENA